MLYEIDKVHKTKTSENNFKIRYTFSGNEQNSAVPKKIKKNVGGNGLTKHPIITYEVSKDDYVHKLKTMKAYFDNKKTAVKLENGIKLSHAMRKCVFGISDQVRFKPASSATKTSYSIQILN